MCFLFFFVVVFFAVVCFVLTVVPQSFTLFQMLWEEERLKKKSNKRELKAKRFDVALFDSNFLLLFFCLFICPSSLPPSLLPLFLVIHHPHFPPYSHLHSPPSPSPCSHLHPFILPPLHHQHTPPPPPPPLLCPPSFLLHLFLCLCWSSSKSHCS